MIPLTNEHRNYMKRQKSTTFSRLIISTLMKKNYYKVSDHSHYTGKYRNGSRNICNLRNLHGFLQHIKL